MRADARTLGARATRAAHSVPGRRLPASAGAGSAFSAARILPVSRPFFLKTPLVGSAVPLRPWLTCGRCGRRPWQCPPRIWRAAPQTSSIRQAAGEWHSGGDGSGRTGLWMLLLTCMEWCTRVWWCVVVSVCSPATPSSSSLFMRRQASKKGGGGIVLSDDVSIPGVRLRAQQERMLQNACRMHAKSTQNACRMYLLHAFDKCLACTRCVRRVRRHLPLRLVAARYAVRGCVAGAVGGQGLSGSIVLRGLAWQACASDQRVASAWRVCRCLSERGRGA